MYSESLGYEANNWTIRKSIIDFRKKLGKIKIKQTLDFKTLQVISFLNHPASNASYLSV